LEELFGVQQSTANSVARSGVWVPKLENPRWFMPPKPGSDEDLVAGEMVSGNALGKSFYFRAISPRASKTTGAEVLLHGAKGTPALSYRRAGKGHAYLLGFSMLDTAFATWKDEDPASRAVLQELLWSIAQQSGVIPRIRSSNSQIEASLRTTAADAYVSVINHEADQARTRVTISQPEFPVAAIHNLTEGSNIDFERDSGGVVFPIDVPRERPQLLRLIASRT
ncbi:MAG: hypothetical protein ACRD3E_06425, partial [Terriglobales bacterium]